MAMIFGPLLFGLMIMFLPIILIALAIEIWFLKFSSEMAYKRKTTWKEAFCQWLWLLGLRFIIWTTLVFILSLLVVV